MLGWAALDVTAGVILGVLVGVDSIFPFCEFSYDGIGLDAEMEVTGGECHVMYYMSWESGSALASRVGLLGRFIKSVISYFLFPRGSFWSELEYSFP